MRSNDKPATAEVKVPPPLLFAGALAVGIVLGRGTATDDRGARSARTMGALCLGAGVTLAAVSIGTLKAAHTNLNPYKPTTALVTAGPFALSRNPVYVALTSLYLGIALWVRSLPALTLLPIVLAVLDRLVVEPEERYLERLFEDEYRTYRARVPRWF